MIALEITWVVETGMPKWAVVRMMVAAVVSAAKPWTGSSFDYTVTHRVHDPPAADGRAQRHSRRRDDDHPGGTSKVGDAPAANSASVMMPIVFWASFEPCEKAMNPAEMT